MYTVSSAQLVTNYHEGQGEIIYLDGPANLVFVLCCGWCPILAHMAAVATKVAGGGDCTRTGVKISKKKIFKDTECLSCVAASTTLNRCTLETKTYKSKVILLICRTVLQIWRDNNLA